MKSKREPLEAEPNELTEGKWGKRIGTAVALGALAFGGGFGFGALKHSMEQQTRAERAKVAELAVENKRLA